MEQERLTATFPVQLSKEEYIRSQEVLSKIFAGGRLFGGNRWFSVALVVLCVIMLAVEAKLAGKVDGDLILVLGLLITVEGVMLFLHPRLLRKNSANAYDKTLYTGYSFDGILTVGPEDIRKRTAKGETAIRYVNCPAYVETADMMIFCGREGRSIVIPARCLTAEDAEIVRAAAFNGVPANRRRLLQKLVPATCERLPEPELTVPEEEVLLSVSVVYTDGELRGILVDGALQKLVRTIVTKALFAVSAAVAGYLWLTVSVVPTFLLCFVLFCFMPVIAAALRAGGIVRQTEGDILRLKVDFTENGVHLHGGGGRFRHLRVPWEKVTRAVERPDCVELYAENRIATIPKRCVEDMDALRDTVDRLMENRR